MSKHRVTVQEYLQGLMAEAPGLVASGVLLGLVAGLLLLTVCSGCVPKVPFLKRPQGMVPTIVVPLDDVPEVKRLDRAMEYWNCVLGVTAFSRRFGADIVQVELAERLLRVDHFGETLHELDEWSRVGAKKLRNGSTFFLMQLSTDLAMVSSATLETIYRHELGHILGLDAMEGDSVMSHDMSSSMGLRDATVLERNILLKKHQLVKPEYEPDFCRGPQPGTGEAIYIPTLGVRK